MEFDVEIWLQEFTRKLFDEFSSRIKFVGLQGSYKRGEATENSDVDLVVILDKLSFEDLIQYKNIVHSLPFYEKADGFICGEDEIYNWPKFELFHLLNDTLPLQGNLLNFIPPLKREDIFNAIKLTQQIYIIKFVVVIYMKTEMKKCFIKVIRVPFIFCRLYIICAQILILIQKENWFILLMVRIKKFSL